MDALLFFNDTFDIRRAYQNRVDCLFLIEVFEGELGFEKFQIYDISNPSCVEHPACVRFRELDVNEDLETFVERVKSMLSSYGVDRFLMLSPTPFTIRDTNRLLRVQRFLPN